MPYDPFEHETPAYDIEVLKRIVRGVAKHPYRFSAVEIGSWVGGTALAIHDEAVKFVDRGGIRVYCVDTWEGNPNDRLGSIAEKYGKDGLLAGFCGNVGDRLFRSIFPCVGTSEFWAKVWPFDVNFIFIDANHEYDHVKHDIEGWSKHVRPGGVICGHDYCKIYPGLQRAVDEFGFDDIDGSVWFKRM